MIPQEPKKNNKTCAILTKMNIEVQKTLHPLQYFNKMIPQEPKKENKTCPILTKMNIDVQKIYIFLQYFVKNGQH